MMPLSSSLIRKTMFFALIWALLLGCVASKTPATRFYTLTPLASDLQLPGDPGRKAPLSIEVASLHLPQYLERPQIVVRSSENRLELAEFHQWGGNLRKNMMRILAKNISQLLETPHISIFPYSPPGSADFRVELEVMKFERDPDGRVRLSVQWRLSAGKDRTPLTAQVIDLVSSTVQTGADLEPTVAAMSALVGELSKRIGREIWKRAQGGPAP